MPSDSVIEKFASISGNTYPEILSESADGTKLPTENKRIDLDQHVSDIVDLHFHPKHGTPYWRERRDELPFDPVEDITGADDLHKFPPADEETLRETPIGDLVPDLIPLSEIIIWTSTGTNGTPKNIPFRKPLLRKYGEWLAWNATALSGLDSGGWMVMGPAGAYRDIFHGTGASMNSPIHYRAATRTMKSAVQHMQSLSGGGWTTLKAAASVQDTVASYLKTKDYMEDFMTALETAEFQHFHAEPYLAQRVYEKLQSEETPTSPEDIATIYLSIGDYSKETRDNLRDLYPNAKIAQIYGTSFQGIQPTHPFLDEMVYYPNAPYAFTDVVDEKRYKPVEFGGRGIVSLHRVSAGFLWPNQLERETAIRNTPSDPLGWNGFSKIQ